VEVCYSRKDTPSPKKSPTLTPAATPIRICFERLLVRAERAILLHQTDSISFLLRDEDPLQGIAGQVEGLTGTSGFSMIHRPLESNS
jgi:hypothetical protein